jgi:hypothetical protein
MAAKLYFQAAKDQQLVKLGSPENGRTKASRPKK